MTGQIGPYQIISELGRGGMGMVYRALQPSVNRIVALKVLPSHLETDETSVRRFRQEAETAANLTHESIVKVWEASLDRPPYYIALEFLEGGTLAERLADGPLPLEEAISIITRVCMALDHAHQRGVVHRDIKPANIMFDGASKPVVTDFGIARAAEHTRLTMTGAKFGTPDYMSPEQAKGLRVDHRTDLYSVAVVLYEMLTGRPPFVNEDSLVTMRQIIDETVPPPSSFNASVPPAVEAVIMRALAKDPNERYQSGAEFSRTLWAAYTAPETVLPTLAALPSTQAAAGDAVGGAHGAAGTGPLPPTTGTAGTRKRLLLGLASIVILCSIALAVYLVLLSRTWSERIVGPSVSQPTDNRKTAAQTSPGAELSGTAKLPKSQPVAAETAKGGPTPGPVRKKLPLPEVKPPKSEHRPGGAVQPKPKPNAGSPPVTNPTPRKKQKPRPPEAEGGTDGDGGVEMPPGR